VAKLVALMLMVMVAAGCSAAEPDGLPHVEDVQTLEVFAPFGGDGGESAHGDGLAVRRALAARMLARASFEPDELEALPNVLSGEAGDNWYGKYVNALRHAGYDVSDAAAFRPGDYLTLGEAQELLDAVDAANNIRFRVDDSNRDLPVSYALWSDLYGRFIAQGIQRRQDTFGITRDSVVVLATWQSDPRLTQWESLTDAGRFSHAGLDLGAYIHSQISVLVAADELLAVLEVATREPVLQFAYMVNFGSTILTAYIGGAAHSYEIETSAQVDGGVAEGGLAHITLRGGRVWRAESPGQRLSGRILRRTGNVLELPGHGNITISGEPVVISTADGTPEAVSLSQLHVGMDQADFYVDGDGTLAAAHIRDWPSGESVRVAISTSGFGGAVHSGVSLRSASGATLDGGRGTRSFAAYEQFSISADMFDDTDRLFIRPNAPGGMLQIMSVTRHGGVHPSFLGVLEVARTEGGFHVINELGMDEYLWGVVPSEMPTYFGEQAAKVQAITARSYAYNQLFANRFAAIGANVCDSVNSQVYNNIAKTPLSIAAVNATSGMFLVYDDRPVSANYFSVSSGHTANSGEVWARGTEFPSHTPSYLRSVRQHDGPPIDMRVEENARAFFQDMGVRALDMHHPWFRWNTELTAQEIAASVNANLAARYNANPALIRTLRPDGSFASAPIESIGDLVNLEVTQRGEGGNIMEMRLEGSRATILVQTEFNIRSLIQARPFLPGGRDIIVHRRDGSTAVNHGMMPSAFYSIMRMTRDDGSLASVRFYGGGSGHGAGMSHAGVRGMTEAGAGFADILRHFYMGAALETR